MPLISETKTTTRNWLSHVYRPEEVNGVLNVKFSILEGKAFIEDLRIDDLKERKKGHGSKLYFEFEENMRSSGITIIEGFLEPGLNISKEDLVKFWVSVGFLVDKDKIIKKLI